MTNEDKVYLRGLAEMAAQLHKQTAAATKDESKLPAVQEALKNFLALVDENNNTQDLRQIGGPLFVQVKPEWPEMTFYRIQIPPGMPGSELPKFITDMKASSGTPRPPSDLSKV